MSNRKFKRQFYMIVEKTLSPDEFVEITTPLTIEFNIERSNLSRENTAHFVIYNLSYEFRNDLYKTDWDIETKPKIEFFAGYEEMSGGLLPRCFKGTVRNCFSYRQGQDWKTEIDAFDGLWTSTTDQISLSLNKGTTNGMAIKKVVAQIDGIESAVIGRFLNNISKRSLAYIGNAHDIITELSKGSFYVDSGVLYCLDKGETIYGDITIINADNGLINTPRFSSMKVEVDMIFEPRVIPSQLITLNATNEDGFNGDYKVTGFLHRGIISDSISGDCMTTLTLLDLIDGEVIFSKSTFDYKAIL